MIFANSEDAVLQAMKELRDERDGTAQGIISRYPAMNRAVNKMFRPYHIYGIAGATGSMKSYLFERLNLDFTNSIIAVSKSDFTADTIKYLLDRCNFVEQGEEVILFPLNNQKIATYTCNLELATKRQLQRRLGDIVKQGLNYMLSSKLDPISSLVGKDIYIKVTDEELKLYEVILSQIHNPVHQKFIDKTQHLEYILNSIWEDFDNSDYDQCVLGIDHVLLLKRSEDDFSAMNNVIRDLIEFAKLGTTIFPITQFNNNYSKPDRWKNPSKHFPERDDIYMGGQFLQGVDAMFCMIQPAAYKCQLYSTAKLPTNKLLHVSNIKGREGGEGDLWFKNYIEHGEIRPCILQNFGEYSELTEIKDLYEQRKFDLDRGLY